MVAKLYLPGAVPNENAQIDLAIGLDEYELCHKFGYWVDYDEVELQLVDFGVLDDENQGVISRSLETVGKLQIRRSINFKKKYFLSFVCFKFPLRGKL